MNTEISITFIFSSFVLISALMVIYSSNAVHSVLFLILVFFNMAILLLFLGAEFISFLLIIVYVGAIAVLFLFVVMMLNTKISSKNMDQKSIWPLGIIIFFIISSQFYNINSQNLVLVFDNNILVLWFNESFFFNNIQVIGKLFYTYYSFLFFLSSFLLLIAMIGAITLTLHHKTNIKKQQINTQLIRNYKGSIKFIYLRK
uniref:NADH-ubiquinone oxidoreductase chain 6 n=1 Tax=Plocamiocolax pulvinatus TaxID=35206 RepID=E5Q3F6_9FLOR|nr:NADH dehydrogenase subunit 6 [Plocamiocolax pulvinata]ADR03239.1 NADH dehydrogenase subunit 6 [Plocamiocolax pulvinata]